MRKRCFNPNCKGYENYGARGITVCDRWDDFHLFVLDMGPRPEGYTLERKNNGNYEPSNCRWSTRSDQSLNRRPYAIEHRSLQLPNNSDPMRCIRHKGPKRFQVRMRVNKHEVSKTFETLERSYKLPC